MAEDNAMASSAAVADVNSSSGGANEHQDKTLKTTLYRTLRFQAFLQGFRDPDVRKAFLAGHFGVEDNSEKMLVCIDKILELILPSLRWEDNPWDAASRTGVTFITDMMDGTAGEPTDKDGAPLPLRKSFVDWMRYFGQLRKAAYWRTFGSNGGACGPNKKPDKDSDVRKGDDMAFDGGADVQGRTTFLPPLKHSSPVRQPAVAMVPGQSDSTLEGSRGDVNLFRGDEPFIFAAQHGRHGPLQVVPKLGTEVNGDPPTSTFYNRHDVLPRKSAWPSKGRDSSSGESDRRGSRSARGTHRPMRALDEVRQADAGSCFPDGKRQGGAPVKIEQHRRGSSAHRHRKRNNSRRRCQSSSSSHVSSHSESSVSSMYSSEGEADHKRDRAMSQMLKKMRFPRDVVAPVIFDGHDGTSLKRFLSDFERYFKEKYSGTDRQCSQLLAEFLSGSARQAYDVLGGATAKYSRVKPQLLKWYKSERVSQRHSAEEEFDRAFMESAESLTIYALRLERLAGIAFPDTKREQERQLCRKFWRTAPSQFTELMVGSERSLALTGKTTLHWRDMKRLAEVEDRHARRMKSESVAPVQKSHVWYNKSKSPHLLQHAVDVAQQSDG